MVLQKRGIKGLGFGISGLVVLALFSSSVSPAFADVQTTTKIKHYPVRGTHAYEIVQSMDSTGPLVDGSHALASIEQDISFKGQLVQTDRCRVKGFGVVVKYEITLPKLKNSKQVNKRTARDFSRFYKKAHSHELVHRKIYLGCARAIDRQVRSLRPQKNCKVFEKKFAQIVKKQSNVCEKKHYSFDQKESRRVGRLGLMRQAERQFRNPPKRKITLSNRDRLMISRTSDRQ